jgi:hypothetical protein
MLNDEVDVPVRSETKAIGGKVPGSFQCPFLDSLQRERRRIECVTGLTERR